MPIEYKIYEDEHYVYAKATGTLTPQEIIDYVNELHHDPNLEPGFKELFDVRFISKSEVTIESFKDIFKKAIADKKRNQMNRLAIVVSKVDSYDRAKYYEKSVSSDKETVIVFNMLDTAKIWLGVDKPET
jgi:hypothetical protein